MPLTVSVPTVGLANSTEAVKVTNSLSALSTWANGNIATTDIGTALAQSAAVNQGGQVVKGATNIAATESRTNVAYGTLTTPDQVTGVVLPANGLIAVWYQATWQESVPGAALAAIFIGANQLKTAPTSGTAAVVQETAQGNGATNVSLATRAAGLSSGGNTGWTGDVTTGQVVSPGLAGAGGPCYIQAAAGTYTVSVQFKASSGSVTASNRKLWVSAMSFA